MYLRWHNIHKSMNYKSNQVNRNYFCYFFNCAKTLNFSFVFSVSNNIYYIKYNEMTPPKKKKQKKKKRKKPKKKKPRIY